MDFNITNWNVITEEDFNEMQFDSGFIVKNFNPNAFVIPTHSDIVDVTSGNITYSLAPTLVDLGKDVNNLHGAFKELQYLSEWDGGKLSYTSLGFSKESYKRTLGAADVSGNKVTPRMYLSSDDFENIAWVGKLIGGGLAAIVLKNALSTGGISITTSKDGKGTKSVTMSGFMSITEQGSVPAEFYAIPPVVISLNRHSAEVGVGNTINLTARTIPDLQTITWTSDDTDKATVSNGVVTGVATGTVTITASMTVDERTVTDSCVVTITNPVLAISRSTAEIAVGRTLFVDVTQNTTGDAVMWTTSDETVVLINGQESVYGNSVSLNGAGTGTATVTATAGELSVTCEVTVP